MRVLTCIVVGLTALLLSASFPQHPEEPSIIDPAKMAERLLYPGAATINDPPTGPMSRHCKLTTTDDFATVSKWYKNTLFGQSFENVTERSRCVFGTYDVVLQNSTQPKGKARPVSVEVLHRKVVGDPFEIHVVITKGENEANTYVIISLLRQS